MKPLQVGAVLVLVALAAAVAWSSRPPGSRASRDPVPPASTGATPASTPSAIPATRHAIAREPRIAVAFRLDSGVTQGLYLGERWVSPPLFRFAQPGDAYVVRAKVQRIDAQGERVDLVGDWSTDDPDLVAIERGNGEVTLVVRGEGQAEVTVATGEGSRVLRVDAQRVDGGMEVGIAQ